MKKYLKKLMTLGALSLMLTGCGASFDVSSSILENYANENSGQYSDVTSDFSEYSYVEGVYVTEIEGAHVELWDFDSTSDALSWYESNVEIIEENSNSTINSGSNNSKSGNYTIKTSDNYYRVLFCDDKGIYSYGEKEVLEKSLEEMGIVE